MKILFAPQQSSYGFLQCCDRQGRLFFHYSHFEGHIDSLQIGGKNAFHFYTISAFSVEKWMNKCIGNNALPYSSLLQIFKRLLKHIS